MRKKDALRPISTVLHLDLSNHHNALTCPHCNPLGSLVDAREHMRAVALFIDELYAIMVDPCAEGTLTVEEMKKALIAAALRDREAAAVRAR